MAVAVKKVTIAQLVPVSCPGADGKSARQEIMPLIVEAVAVGAVEIVIRG